MIYIKDQCGGTGHVITDLKWFSDIITKMFHCKQTASSLSDRTLMVHPETEVITLGNVKDITKDSVEVRQVRIFYLKLLTILCFVYILNNNDANDKSDGDGKNDNIYLDI